jgi:hypothetical protein
MEVFGGERGTLRCEFAPRGVRKGWIVHDVVHGEPDSVHFGALLCAALEVRKELLFE